MTQNGQKWILNITFKTVNFFGFLFKTIPCGQTQSSHSMYDVRYCCYLK